MKEKKQLMTPDEVAAILRIARKTVVVKARNGEIPCIRVGKLVRFDQADIDRWINSQRP
jgi:excisionase family DNA binding protein